MACVIGINNDDIGRGGARTIRGSLVIGTTSAGGSTPVNFYNTFANGQIISVLCGQASNLRLFHNQGLSDVGGIRIEYSNGTNVPASVDLSGVNITFQATGPTK